MNVVVLHSDTAEGAAALAAAVHEARVRGTGLTVLSTLSGSDEPRSAEVEREVLTARVAGDVPADVDWDVDLVAPGADAAGSLIERIERLDPVLVVLGSRSRSTVGKLLLGRTLQRILLDVTAQILVVKTPTPA
ncbi:universal stress protein [Nocardioides sp. C4-1]|uniref:universal stress protein n=1 Tax=Nocardioides sp. C4-1 TaxID=3151851 RepID=UPI003263CDE6